MRKLLFVLAIAAVELLLFSFPSFAQCDLQENDRKLTGLRLGRFDLHFKAGSFVTRNPQGTAHGQRFDFVLGSEKPDIDIAVLGEPERPSIYNVKGTLHLARPVTGNILQEIVQGSCQQTITLDASTLSGSSITGTKASVPPWFGGAIILGGARLTFLDNEAIVSGPRQSRGLVTFASSKLQLKDTSISFPFGNGIDRRIALKANDSNSRLQLDFSTFTTLVVRADLRSDPVVFDTIQTDAAYLHVDLTKVKAEQIKVEVLNKNKVDVSLTKVTANARRISHDSPLWAETSKEAPISWDALLLHATKADAKGIAVGARGGSYQGVKSSLTMQIGKSPTQKLASGAAALLIKSISDAEVDAQIDFTSPQIDLFTGSRVSATLTELKVSAFGPKLTAKLATTGKISILQLAGLTAKADMDLKLTGQVNVAASLQIASKKGEVTIGASSINQISGQTAGFALAAVATSLDPVAGFRFDLAKNGLKIDVELSKNSLPVLGGKIEVSNKKIHLQNDEAIVLTANPAPQLIAIVTSELMLSGVTYRPNHSADVFPAQATPYKISTPKFAFVLGAPTDRSSFSLDCDIELPGFSLKPPPPIKSIVVDVGGYEVEVSSLDVGGFEIIFHGSDVEVALKNLSLGIGQFRTQTNPDGTPATNPVIAGAFSTPLTIARASVTYHLWPNPFAFEDMEIDDLHVALSLSSVVTPNVFEVKDSSLDLNIAKATSVDLQARLVMTSASVAWRDDVSGYAVADRIELNVSGPRKALNGDLTISVESVNAAGTVKIDVGSDNSAATVNCIVTIPAKVAFSIRKIHGHVDIAGGGISGGGIVADEINDGEFRYVGENDCSFGLPLSLTVKVTYPCIPDFWNDCDVTLHAEVRIPARLSVRSLNVNMQLGDVRFDVDGSNPQHPKFKWCKAFLRQLVPELPGQLVEITPDFSPIPWPFNTIANDVADAVLAPFYASFENSVIDVISVLSIVGVGNLKPVKDSCSF